MRKLFYMGLERYEGRYTLQLQDMEEKISDMRRSNGLAQKHHYEKYPDERYILTATQAMAAQIDRDVLTRGQGINKD